MSNENNSIVNYFKVDYLNYPRVFSGLLRFTILINLISRDYYLFYFLQSTEINSVVILWKLTKDSFFHKDQIK